MRVCGNIAVLAQNYSRAGALTYLGAVCNGNDNTHNRILDFVVNLRDTECVCCRLLRFKRRQIYVGIIRIIRIVRIAVCIVGHITVIVRHGFVACSEGGKHNDNSQQKNKGNA